MTGVDPVRQASLFEMLRVADYDLIGRLGWAGGDGILWHDFAHENNYDSTMTERDRFAGSAPSHIWRGGRMAPGLLVAVPCGSDECRRISCGV